MNPTKITVLLQVFDDFQHILLRYSSDFTMKTPREGFDTQYREWSQKLRIAKALIKDVEQA